METLPHFHEDNTATSPRSISRSWEAWPSLEIWPSTYLSLAGRDPLTRLLMQWPI